MAYKICFSLSFFVRGGYAGKSATDHRDNTRKELPRGLFFHPCVPKVLRGYRKRRGMEWQPKPRTTDRERGIKILPAFLRIANWCNSSTTAFEAVGDGAVPSFAARLPMYRLELQGLVQLKQIVGKKPLKAIKADLPTNLQTIELLVLADYHYADPNSDHDAIKRDLDYIATHDNVYCVLAGDLMDCAIKSSLGDIYVNLSPMEELTACMDLIGPIADRVVGVVGGNHESRHYKTNGVDMTRLLAKQLGIEDRYSPDTALIFLRTGKDNSKNHNRPILYTIYLAHGTGGGRKEGGKIQRLVDLSTIADADIYICGHTHLPASLKTAFARPCAANNSITYCTRLYVNAGAKLSYGGYGDVGGYRPNAKDTPKIILSGTEKQMYAMV